MIIAVIIACILILFYVTWASFDQKMLVTTEYQIVSPKIGREFNGTGFIVLADLHNHGFGKDNERLLHKIYKLSPDFILIAGDMVNKKEPCLPGNAFTLLEQLSKRYPVYYSYGNHEQRLEQLGKEINETSDLKLKETYSTWIEYKNRLIKNNVTFLDNESVVIMKTNERIRISGVSLDRSFFEKFSLTNMPKDYLSSLLGNRRENIEDYQILIAHNPFYFREYAYWGADLILSGHLHGGIIRIPGFRGIISPQVRLFPKYDAGRFTEAGHDMIVSRGLGSHSFMLRMFNPPELIFVRLLSDNNK